MLNPIPFSIDSPAPGVDVPALESISSPDVYGTIGQHTSSPAPHVKSTPNPTGDSSVSVTDQMRTVIQEIGHQLADSIMSRLQPHNTVAPSADTHVESSHCQPTRVSDYSQVQIVTQRKVKEPPSFVGDGSDSVKVHEWEDLMRTFIKKSNVRVEDQAEEILMHLRGKAKDVVRFGIRNSNIDMHAQPDMIYGLLRKHFSSARYSAVPLAEFYSTLPNDHEDPYDYWLRLNRAADLATDCLREQGKTLENPEMEVTRMFIRNCPCKDLALTFRSKTIDKWTACEVLEVLNEYHAEMSCKANPPVQPVRRMDVAVHNAEVTPVPTHNSHEPPQAQSQQYVSLAEVMDMLEKVVLRGASDQSKVRRRTPLRRPEDRIDGFTDKPCIICKDDGHSAFSHCRDKRLCFKCYAPGPSRHDCPLRSTVPQPEEN